MMIITYDDIEKYRYKLHDGSILWHNLQDNTCGIMQYSEFNKAAKKLNVEFIKELFYSSGGSYRSESKFEQVFNTVEETEKFMRGTLLKRFRCIELDDQFWDEEDDEEDEGFVDDEDEAEDEEDDEE